MRHDPPAGRRAVPVAGHADTRFHREPLRPDRAPAFTDAMPVGTRRAGHAGHAAPGAATPAGPAAPAVNGHDASADKCSRSLRVLHISKFYPPVMGGIESVAWELAEGLNRAGLHTDVLCSHQRPLTAHEHTASGYEVVRAGSLGMLLSTSVSPAMLQQAHRMAQGRDVVHVHMPDPMAALAIWATRPKAALVVHWHSDVIRQRKALLLYGPLQNWLLQRAARIVATSPTYAETSLPLRRHGHKVAVIPIGISDNHTQASVDKAQAIRQRFRGRRIVFALGRMTYYKGYEVLIDAAAQLPDDCVVVIGGDGELLEQHRATVRQRGLSGKVHLVGHINDDELPSYFEACEVYCLSSTARAEAYGVAMIEAMVMGKPIVASNIVGSGVPWVNTHGHTGLNVAVGQPRPLADALLQLLADAPLRAELGRAARERYLADFNADLMTRRTIALYESI